VRNFVATLREGHSSRKSEMRVSRGIFTTTKNEVIEGWKTCMMWSFIIYILFTKSY
jgi:hypothetical protein